MFFPNIKMNSFVDIIYDVSTKANKLPLNLGIKIVI